MIPGPDQIIACPQCGHLARYGTLMSGNSAGAHFWTDGRQVAPMLPLPPTVVKCRECVAVYWLSDAREVGTIDPWQRDEQQPDPAWAEAAEVEEPSEQEYYDALDSGLATDGESERTARILAWWRRNDRWRDSWVEPSPEAPHDDVRWKDNLQRLIHFLDEGDEGHGLMKAEVLRELGEFERAMQVLRNLESPEIEWLIRQLMAFCEERDAVVRELRLSD